MFQSKLQIEVDFSLNTTVYTALTRDQDLFIVFYVYVKLIQWNAQILSVYSLSFDKYVILYHPDPH